MNPVYFALDTDSVAQATRWVSEVGDLVGGLKVGLELWCAVGPLTAKEIVRGHDWFLDLKLHDIPRTVSRAIRAVVPLEPTFLTIHQSGGEAMMGAAVRAATDAAQEFGVRRPKLLAVTTLTSLPAKLDTVARQGYKARACGVDGIVCPPHAVATARDELGKDCILVVPGIRLNQVADDDQTQIATPKVARESGADILVIGRPITTADDVRRAAEEIQQNLNS